MDGLKSVGYRKGDIEIPVAAEKSHKSAISIDYFIIKGVKKMSENRQ